MNYQQAKERLLNVTKLVDDLLPGRLKYDSRTLEPLPFEGISVIHNINKDVTEQLGLSQMARSLISKIARAKLESKIAFVSTESFHATTFDLINEKEHSEQLKAGGFDYKSVRQRVRDIAVGFLKNREPRLVETISVTGIGMFAPAVLKLDLAIDNGVLNRFQDFRLELHRTLVAQVDGYSIVRRPDWDRKLSGHITFGYVVNPVTGPEIDLFIDILENFNAQFRSIEFDISLGEVTQFTDMNHYFVVP